MKKLLVLFTILAAASVAAILINAGENSDMNGGKAGDDQLIDYLGV